MELSELTAYAREKYRIREERKLASYAGFSLLRCPGTGKCLAILIREWDTETGVEIEHCDLKCGSENLPETLKPYLTKPIRMSGTSWIGIDFDERTERELVFRLFDLAVASARQSGATIVLGVDHVTAEPRYRDTPLPFSDSSYRAPKEAVPERLHRMRRSFSYGGGQLENRAKTFYQLGKSMEDYEDDAPWPGDFVCFYPTYQDLNTAQLRGYFSWRTHVRRGEFLPISPSAAYLYLYELLNGIGCTPGEDCLNKLRAFEAGYLDAGMGDTGMRRNLRRWMLEYAVVQAVPAELARAYADAELIEKDRVLSFLRNPGTASDEELFSALSRFGGKKLPESPVFPKAGDRARRLFCEAWRLASAQYRYDGKDLFTLCFGQRSSRRWYPLANAVVYRSDRGEDRDYTLDDCRAYRYRGGEWRVDTYEKTNYDLDRIAGFLHETDLRLRRYFKTGRPLRAKPADGWAAPFIEAAIEADRRAEIEAAKPFVSIDLSDLDRIRRDAVITRDSLLTEEERMEPEENLPPVAEAPAEPDADLPLDGAQLRILRALLRDITPDDIIRENRLIPSIIADGINEALFDEIGDVVILCEDDRLTLVEDYRDELAQLVGGTQT